MNSPFRLSRFAAIAVFVTLTSLLGACGQKGPLYLQAEPAPAAATTTATIPAPTPAATPVSRPVSTPLPAIQ